MIGLDKRRYATLRLLYPDAEQTEGFADIPQAAAWTLARQHAARWEALIPAVHASREDVLAQLEGDAAAHARFLARCGESDERILAGIGDCATDVRAVLAGVRDELALMAEHDEDCGR
jgi:hypothetical protein